jgi:hypothetical protein
MEVKMEGRAAQRRAQSVHSLFPVIETVPGFAGSVTVTSTANSGSLHVVGVGFSTATIGASLGGVYRATYADPPEEYDPDFVASILQADAKPTEAQFDNVVDMLNWLNRD